MLTILIMAMVQLTFLISVFGIYLYRYILHTSKLIFITMHLWIFLSMVLGGYIVCVPWSN